MLLKTELKDRFSLLLANTLMHFIRLCQERGLMDLIVKFSQDHKSVEFKMLRDRLAAMFTANINNEEMLLMYEEVEVLIREKGALS